MEGFEHERDRGWAERIRAGDATAFEALFQAYFDKLCTSCLRYVHTPDVADSLVQDVFVSIWQRRASWVPRRTVRTYLYGAVRNEALKYLRHQEVVRRWQEEQQEKNPPPTRRPDEDLNYKELRTAVQHGIDQLPERRRRIFVFHRHDGLTYREIATLLDISVSTVETQIGRALDNLREFVDVSSLRSL